MLICSTLKVFSHEFRELWKYISIQMDWIKVCFNLCAFMLHVLLALDLCIFIEACLVLSYIFCYELFLLPILMLYTARIPLDAWLNLRAI